jgi:hypothetical protein
MGWPNVHRLCSRTFGAALISACLVSLLGCAVRDASPDGVTIVYNALHPEIADYRAQQHCNGYGKNAVLVETIPVAPSFETLFTRSTRSVFRCMEATAPSGP